MVGYATKPVQSMLAKLRNFTPSRAAYASLTIIIGIVFAIYAITNKEYSEARAKYVAWDVWAKSADGQICNRLEGGSLTEEDYRRLHVGECADQSCSKGIIEGSFPEEWQNLSIDEMKMLVFKRLAIKLGRPSAIPNSPEFLLSEPVRQDFLKKQEMLKTAATYQLGCIPVYAPDLKESVIQSLRSNLPILAWVPALLLSLSFAIRLLTREEHPGFRRLIFVLSFPIAAITSYSAIADSGDKAIIQFVLLFTTAVPVSIVVMACLIRLVRWVRAGFNENSKNH